MKILYYTHTYFLDCDFPLVKSLLELGHDVYLLFEIAPHCLKSPIFEIKEIKQTTAILNISEYSEFERFSKYFDKTKTFVLNRIGKGYGVENIRLRSHFKKFVNKINPDIIHCTDFIDVYDFFLYTHRKKIVQIVHDPFPHKGECNVRKMIGRSIGLFFLSKFVLLNNKQTDKFIQTYRLSPKKVFHNTLGTYDCIKDFSSKEYFTDLSNNIVLFWGRISPYKGIEYLLQAARIIHEKKHNVVFVIAGAGSFYFDVSQYKNDKLIKIINRFVSMGELKALLEKSIVTVCPYTDATQSGVVMTSYTMQVPVIVTNVGGLPEMVRDNQTGYVVPSHNVEQLANAIIKIQDDESLRLAMRNQLLRLEKEDTYSWEKIAKKYVDIYLK